MGVYGNLLREFPELKRRIQTWSKEDKSDSHYIVGVYIPTKGDILKRWKFGNRGSAINYSDDDTLYVNMKQLIDVGDYFYDPDTNSGDIHRVVGLVNYGHPGGFRIYKTERVTGATVDQQEELKVKEAEF